MIALILSLCVRSTIALDVVGWYVDGQTPYLDPKDLAWDKYTHFVVGAPAVSEKGVATCNHSDTTTTFVNISQARNHTSRIVWRSGIPPKNVWLLLTDSLWSEYKKNYLSSIGSAVAECGVDGIEFDYECPPTPLGRLGIVSDLEATQYTQFLADVRTAMGKDKQISCDMGVWGVTRGSYPLMFKPWVNVSMVNVGAIDYVNTMSYHYPALADEVFPWEKDVYVLHTLWGLSKERINIGLAWYFHNGTDREPLWSQLSSLCPNIEPNATHCAGVHIISKDDNYEVGQLVKSAGFRGVFPWAANFDSLEFNNSLIDWLHRGLTD